MPNQNASYQFRTGENRSMTIILVCAYSHVHLANYPYGNNHAVFALLMYVISSPPAPKFISLYTCINDNNGCCWYELLLAFWLGLFPLWTMENDEVNDANVFRLIFFFDDHLSVCLSGFSIWSSSIRSMLTLVWILSVAENVIDESSGCFYASMRVKSSFFFFCLRSRWQNDASKI